MLTVSAVEKGSGQENEIVIKNDRNRLSEEDIERLIREAEENAEEDKKARELVELKNQLQSMISDAKSKLNSENENNIIDDISDEDKDALDEAVEEADDWMQENEEATKEDFQAAIDKLDAVVRPVLRKYSKKAGDNTAADDEDDFDFKDEL